MPGPIVIGYDASDGARAALEAGLELAGGLGVPVVIAYGFAPPGSTLSGEEAKAHRDALEEDGKRLVGEAEERAQAAGVVAEAALVEQRPAAALAALAEARGASYIVVGSYGESPIKGAILGSTPHKLLHLAETPVVVVPA